MEIQIVHNELQGYRKILWQNLKQQRQIN